MRDDRLTTADLSMLRTVAAACELGPNTVYLFEGGHKLSWNVWTIDEALYTAEERSAIGNLIRWGYCKWTGFIAGDLGCKITESGREQLQAVA